VILAGKTRSDENLPWVPGAAVSSHTTLGRTWRAVSHPHRARSRKKQRALSDSLLGQALLDSAEFYQQKQRWQITLFLLMPDHLHALLSFPRNQSMSELTSDWKRFHTAKNRVVWQEGYFDHRLRNDERGEKLSAKMNYIRQNPVAAAWCAKAEDWPWVIDPYR
jgi:REP element-mobilizing transposase RayT